MPTRNAADIMTRSVVTLAPDLDIYGAMQCLLKKKISGAPVVDSDGRLVGMLSEKDCLKVLAGEALDGLPEGKVSDYMTRSVESITPTTSIYDVVHNFLQLHVRRLPVVDQTRARGRASQSERCACSHRVHPATTRICMVRRKGTSRRRAWAWIPPCAAARGR